MSVGTSLKRPLQNNNNGQFERYVKNLISYDKPSLFLFGIYKYQKINNYFDTVWGIPLDLLLSQSRKAQNS